MAIPAGAQAALTRATIQSGTRREVMYFKVPPLLKGCFAEQADIRYQSEDHQRSRRRAVGFLRRLHGAAALSVEIGSVLAFCEAVFGRSAFATRCWFAALSVVMDQCWLSVRLFCRGQHSPRNVASQAGRMSENSSAPLRCAVSGEIAPCGLRRCAVAPLLVYAGAVVRAHAVVPLRRCAVLGVLRYPDVRMRRCAVAPCRRAGFIKMPGRAYAPLRRCAVASCLDYDATGRAGFVPLLCSCAQCNGATEQRSGVALLRHGRSGTEQRSAEQRSGVAPLRHGAPARRFGAEQRSTEQRRGAAPLRPKRTEHGARSGASEYGAKQFRGRMFHPQCNVGLLPRLHGTAALSMVMISAGFL